MKYLVYFFLLFLLACKSESAQEHETPASPGGKNSGDRVPASITINAMGDMMLGTDFPDRKKFTTKNILATLSDTLADADFTIGNLEGVLAHDTVPSKKCKNKKNCYAFRSPPAFAEYFRIAGFDFLSIANNHSGDFDEEGLRQTMKALNEQGIKYAGLKNICEYAVLEKDGIKLGVIGVGHAWRHVYINDYGRIRNIIKKLKQEADVVSVFFHGGAEGDSVERVPMREEFFFKESRGNVHEFAHMCVDVGADLVIGSGPHVTRAMELYKGRLIAYSLGNFATYGKVGLGGPMGIAPILKIQMSETGEFLGGRIIPTIQKPLDPSTPMIDSSGAVIKRLISLNMQDFPQNQLATAPDGTLTIKNF